MNSISLITNRLVWIDVMKIIGMYFIVVGHMFPAHYEVLYTFSVPLFFIISGYLAKRDSSEKSFWKKIAVCYMIPVMVLTAINTLFVWILKRGEISATILDYFITIATGAHSPGCSGLRELWFIYTLIALLVSYRYLSVKILSFIILPATILIAYYWNSHNIELWNAFANYCVALPFFLVGIYAKRYSTSINAIGIPIRISIVIAILCLATLIVCAEYNGSPWMYINSYGRNFAVFIIGALAGSFLVFIIAKILPPQ